MKNSFWKIVCLGVMVSVCSVGIAGKCRFDVPKVNKEACQVLNNSKDLTQNPFFLENQNTACGVNMDLPGLPTFNLGDYLPDLPDACKTIKSVTGDDVLESLRSAMGL